VTTFPLTPHQGISDFFPCLPPEGRVRKESSRSQRGHYTAQMANSSLMGRRINPLLINTNLVNNSIR